MPNNMMTSGASPFTAGSGMFGFSPFQQGMGAGGIGGLLGGLFGDSGAPYEDAMKKYREWAAKAQGVQDPFLKAGTGAIGDYQKWLQGMQDPTKFINNITSQYEQSPYAKFLTQQGQNAGMNAASASGLVGSTPFAQQLQSNAQGIASGDMQNWLQNVLGVNSQYGQGQGNLMNMGQNSANALTNMYSQMGQQMGDAAYGRKAGQQQDFMNMIGGAGSLAMMFL